MGAQWKCLHAKSKNVGPLLQSDQRVTKGWGTTRTLIIIILTAVAASSTEVVYHFCHDSRSASSSPVAGSGQSARHTRACPSRHLFPFLLLPSPSSFNVYTFMSKRCSSSSSSSSLVFSPASHLGQTSKPLSPTQQLSG